MYQNDHFGREIAPIGDYNNIVSSIENIITKIVNKKSFSSMYEEIELSEFTPKDFNTYDFNYGNFKEWLEKHFICIMRGNIMGSIPPYIIWKIQFEPIKIKLTQKQAFSLLESNFSYYSREIKHSYDKNYNLTVNVAYDLTKDKFTKYY